MQKSFFFVLVFLTLYITLSCDKNDDEVTNSISIISASSIDIKELSGLCALSSDILYTVSDNTNKIYKISTSGKILSSFSFALADLEGIAVNPNDQSIYVVEERKREITQFNKLGTKIRSITVNVKNREINSGLEGICIDPTNNNIFVLNEKSPGKLIELNSDGSQINSTDLHFASDYSGLCINPDTEELWILSDESRKLFKCNKKGSLIKEYNININKMEGIAIDFNSEKIYIVSDAYKKIYQLKLPNK